MPCRCLEISVLRNDIKELNAALGYISDAIESEENTIKELKSASSYYEDAVVFNGKEAENAKSILEAYDEAKKAIADASTATSTAITDANSRLDLLVKEDESYHGKEDKK